MPSWSVSEPHTLGTAKAIQSLKRFTSILRSDWGSMVAEVEQESWNGSTLTFKLRGVKGRVITGTVTTTDSAATVTATCDRRVLIPAGIIEAQIRSALRRALKGD